jgi:hypothetical protein
MTSKKQPWTREMYVPAREDLSACNLHGDLGGVDVEPVADGARRAGFSLFDPGFFGNAENDLSVDFLDSEASRGISHGGLEKLADAAQGHIPQPSRRRRSYALDKLSAEDFEEGAERNAFLVIEDHSRKLFPIKTPHSKPSQSKTVSSSLTFFFTIEDFGTEITFPLCCNVLGARVDVFQLRIQYEWWLRGTIFTGPFPFTTVPVPRAIAGEITYYGGDEGYALARECWVQPGITGDELISSVAELDDYATAKLKAALASLEDRLLMCSQAGRWYVTGRNPLLMSMRAESIHGLSFYKVRGGSFHWSRLFGES